MSFVFRLCCFLGLLFSLFQCGVLQLLVLRVAPGALAEDAFQVFTEDDFLLYELIGQLAQAVAMLREDADRLLIGLFDNLAHLLVDGLGSLFTIGFGEAVVLLTRRVIIAQVAYLFIQTVVGHHGKGLLGHLLKVGKGARRDLSEDHLLSGATAEGGYHLVIHLLLGGNLAFLRQIPGGTE